MLSKAAVYLKLAYIYKYLASSTWTTRTSFQVLEASFLVTVAE
jgi:hypothetical protein